MDIHEQTTLVDKYGEEFIQKVKTEKAKMMNYYKNYYSSADVKKKFNNADSQQKILKYIDGFKIKLSDTGPSNRKSAGGWVDKEVPYVINLNMQVIKNYPLYNTLVHEAGHLIEFFMETIGEKPINTNLPTYNRPTNDQDSYVANSHETYTRVQRLREILNLSPNVGGDELMNKLVSEIRAKRLVFPNKLVSISNDKKTLMFKTNVQEKGVLTDLWKFFADIRYNNVKQDDIGALFAKFSIIKGNVVHTNIAKLGEINVSMKGVSPQNTNLQEEVFRIKKVMGLN